MNVLNKGDLKKLMGEHKGPCISIFMPTHRGGAETQQDQTRFKNLLRDAEKGLLKIDLGLPEAKELLEPAQTLLQNSLFWGHQSDGLAIFVSPQTFGYYRLPVDFKELLVVAAGRFHIKPLLPLISGDGRFYVLALSQNEVRLFHGSRYSVVEIDLKGVPGSLADAPTGKDLQKQFHFHAGTPGTKGERAAIFHGHGIGSNDNKERIMRYFREVDREVHNVLKNKRVPLVLAGVEYLFPLYKHVSTYSYLVNEGVAGNPERLSPEKLHGQAWKIVRPYFEKEQRDAVAQYRQTAGTDRASCDVKAIVPAAYYGKVELLFVAVGLQLWGTFEADTNLVQLHDEAKSGDEDLLSFAAIHALLNGGSVYGVEPDRLPDDAPLAAVFRY